MTWVRERGSQLARFAAVGATGVVVNLGAFNLLRLGPLSPDAEVAGDEDRVVTAKVIATVISIAFAWWAHRGWTFRGGRRHGASREITLFLAVNGVALVLEAAVVATSHHGLGYTSLWADNVASVIGIGLATVTRYAGYSLFVFHAAAPVPSAPDEPPASGADAS
ncbi:GtrA family protein [Demequina sp. SO4-18]|uniref:GtrA family protein n=1 Tax=Demequina sp. SO4-18 TaxID=3401026 RepID=UPI003B5C63FF